VTASRADLPGEGFKILEKLGLDTTQSGRADATPGTLIRAGNTDAPHNPLRRAHIVTMDTSIVTMDMAFQPLDL
jgi:hypothetical protein